MTDSMGVGLHYGGADTSMPLVDLARAAEARGFESLFVPEHSRIPSVAKHPSPVAESYPTAASVCGTRS